MYERISLMLGKAFTASVADLKREEGQGATEYAMVVGFVIVGLTLTLGLLGTSIEGFLGRVAAAIDGLVP
jgi:Flp pilus assembly pilin Flp